MKLFYNGPSPYGRKVIVAAHEFGLIDRLELVPTDPWKHSEEMVAVNPGGKVPALIKENGSVVTESTTICEYFMFLASGNLKFDEQYVEILARAAMGQGIIDAGYTAVIEGRRPADKRWQDWVDRQMSALYRLLAAAQTKPGRFDIGDISLACGLAYLDFRLPQVIWRQSQPALASWLDEVALRPSMQKTDPRVK